MLRRFHQMGALKRPDGMRMSPKNLKIPERVLKSLRVDPNVYINGPPA